MGPNETASTITGGPLKIVIFDVQQRAKAQIKHFFGMLIGSRTPSGLNPLLVRRLHRIRYCAGHAIALKVLTSPTSLIEFFSRPPSAGYRLQFRRICMKTGPEYL